MDENEPVGPPPLEERFAALGTVKPGWVPWPADKPFPWSDAECAAFVRGHKVKWPGTFEDFMEHLPGRVEMIEGYLSQKI